MTVTMKNLLAALLLCTHMLNPEAGVLHGGGEAVFDARTEKFENNKRCLLGETGDETFCGAHIDPLVMDEGSSFSEASFQASSPAPIEADMLGSDMGEPQVIDSYNEKEILERITQARLYMQQTVMTDEKFAKVRSLCKNVNSQCAFWASIGECENNPGMYNFYNSCSRL